MMTYVGIDFSGAADKWGHTVSTAQKTVWIAKVRQETSVKVEWVRPIQEFSGNEPPFQRLANFLKPGVKKDAQHLAGLRGGGNASQRKVV
jgi:hypothetical protein